MQAALKTLCSPCKLERTQHGQMLRHRRMLQGSVGAGSG